MRNIEIKARLADYSRAQAVAASLPEVQTPYELHQIDTYFRVHQGRLKLREISGAENHSQLIHYRRPDQAGPKGCDYNLIPVADPAALKTVLTAALGVSVVVRKRRIVYLWQYVRIHLDHVDDLGQFIEFEAVLDKSQTDDEGQQLVVQLMEQFGIANEDLLKTSYSDMLGL